MTYKTSSRAAYSTSRSRTLPSPDDYTQEVLLFNAQGQITEGSFCTPYFQRDRRWVTPAVREVGGQRGTSRRWALERGLCVEGAVEVGSVRVGERVWTWLAGRGATGAGAGEAPPTRWPRMVMWGEGGVMYDRETISAGSGVEKVDAGHIRKKEKKRKGKERGEIDR